jgi:hypothetical protein
LRARDVIQQLDGSVVSSTSRLFAALIAANSAPIKVRVIRNQQPVELTLPPVPFIETESAPTPSGFTRNVPRGNASVRVAANQETHNDPLSVLTDGALAESYGPVFANDVGNGAYMMDLGTAKPIVAVSSWSFNQNGNRGRQVITLYGSKATNDPGWNLKDEKRFRPLGSIDTASLPGTEFTATSLRAPKGKTLGTFRWVVWETAPVTDIVENTAWQEFSVEVAE